MYRLCIDDPGRSSSRSAILPQLPQVSRIFVRGGMYKICYSVRIKILTQNSAHPSARLHNPSANISESILPRNSAHPSASLRKGVPLNLGLGLSWDRLYGRVHFES